MSRHSIGEKFQTKPLPMNVSSRMPITLHEHQAEKAGKHYDLRLGGKGDWAIRYFPTTPGEKRLAVRQPTHPTDYYSFSGDITEGYGKGKVSIKYKGNAEIQSWEPNKINFSFDNKSYVLLKTGEPDRWLIMMKKPKLDKLSYHKCNDDARLKSALKFDAFGDALKQKVKAMKTKNSPHGIVLRAENEFDHRDTELFRGIRSRAYQDMALSRHGF